MVILSYCRIVLLPSCSIVLLPYCLIVSLSSSPVLWPKSSVSRPSGLWGHLHRAEESDQGDPGVCWQDLHLHLHPGDATEVDRLRFQEVLHQLLVLAGLPHRGRESQPQPLPLEKAFCFPSSLPPVQNDRSALRSDWSAQWGSICLLVAMISPSPQTLKQRHRQIEMFRDEEQIWSIKTSATLVVVFKTKCSKVWLREADG